MPAREIPREEWVGFFDNFSAKHRGWVVNVEVQGDGAGSKVEGHGLPLMGISADCKGSEAPAIAIMLGESPGDHVTHIVPSPKRVRFLENAEGAHEGVEVETQDGTKTIVRFREPARPQPAHVM